MTIALAPNILTNIRRLLATRRAFILGSLAFPLLIFLHNPRHLIRPELWGEDGPLWYKQAYELGIASLLVNAGGYLNSIQRLAAIALQPFPLAWMPFLFATVALLIHAAPAIFLVSKQMEAVWPDQMSRYLFAILFLVLPNAPEVAAGLTNSQWYLALLTFLILVSSVPGTRIGRLLETVVLAASGLSGPFGLLLMPTALLETWSAGSAQRPDALRRVAVLFVTGLIQIAYILATPGNGRSTAPLGASPGLFIQIVGMISLGAESGYRQVASWAQLGFLKTSGILYIFACMSSILVIVSLIRGPRLLLQYWSFAAAAFGLSLARPLISGTEIQWPLMLTPPLGNRYLFFPMIGWLGTLLVLSTSSARWLSIFARCLLALTALWAIPNDWGDLFAIPPSDFIQRARIFDAAPAGTTMEFEIHPGWKMTLTK